MTHIKAMFGVRRQGAPTQRIGRIMVLGEDHGLARRREPAEARLVLLPIGYPSAGRLGSLAHDLSLSGIKTTIAPNQDIESSAYTPSRGQYRADVLLDQVRRAVGGRVLAVTDADLYVPDLNLVFSMADHSRRAAIVSLHRLRLGAGAALLREQSFKEALHEIGHTFGLAHCFDARCVMSFSNSLSEVDRKSRRFCQACHGARCGEGPVLAMLPRIKSGVRVAALLPSPALRAAAW